MKKTLIMLANIAICIVILSSVTAVEQVNAKAKEDNKILEKTIENKKTKALAELNAFIKKLSERNSDEEKSIFENKILSNYDPVKPCIIPLLPALIPLLPFLLPLLPYLIPLLPALIPLLPYLIPFLPVGLPKVTLPN